MIPVGYGCSLDTSQPEPSFCKFGSMHRCLTVPLPVAYCVQEDVFCDEFHLADLRVYENCTKLVQGCDHVFNLAADMGGMGFIQSNHSVIL